MWPAIIAAGGGLLASYLTNQSNVSMQRETNQQSLAAAREQMQFQERMSNTSHQREVKDLQAAGLNPNLSAGTQGSSSPQGAAPTLTAPQIQMPDIMSFGVSLKQLDLAEKRLEMDREKNLIDVASGKEDVNLKQLQKILMKRGMPRAELEGEAADVIRNVIKYMKTAPRKNPKEMIRERQDTEQQIKLRGF